MSKEISMPLEEYQEELIKNQFKGRLETLNEIMKYFNNESLLDEHMKETIELKNELDVLEKIKNYHLMINRISK